jgi:hypothetical protein
MIVKEEWKELFSETEILKAKEKLKKFNHNI